MASGIAQLLGVTEHSAELAIAKLEQLSGYHGEDNRLLSDIRIQLRHKVASLGFDPDDTTPKELYHGLLAHFDRDSRVFSSIVGNLWHTNPDKFSDRIIQLVQLCDIPAEAWVLKRSAAKDILKRQPPKRLMKHLGYRSAESMLKREDIDELYAGLVLVESSSWLKDFYRKHSYITPSDFEIRTSKFVTMPSNRWGRIEMHENVTTVPQLGIVALWPIAEGHRHHAVRTFIDTVNAIEYVRVCSFALMKDQMAANFGQHLVRQLELGPQPILSIGHIPVSWHNLHHYWGHLPKELHPLSEPHFMALDTHKIEASTALSGLHPSFRWWSANDWLGAVTQSDPVSVNLADAAHNFAYKKSYQARHTGHLKSSTWNELISRYMPHQGVSNHVLSHLDTKPSGLEAINSLTPKTKLQHEAAWA